MNILHRIFVIPLFFMLVIPLQAQQDRDLMARMLAEDKAELEALAMYPEAIRMDILEAASHPEVLARMQIIQEHSSEKFKNLLSTLDREDQERIWELARYPALVRSIAEGGKKSESQLSALAQEYPEEVRDIAVQYGRGEYRLIEDMDRLNRASEEAFSTVLEPYDARTRGAYATLLTQPEILSILAENMSMTVILGDLYKSDPEYVMQKTDSLAVEAAARNAQELEDWKKSLEEDPEAMQELEEAAQSYAAEQGVSEEEYLQPVTRTEVRYVAYPYWYGYPWWYDSDPFYTSYYYSGYSWWYAYPRWYPRPWWYHWGFYYGPGRRIVFWSLPSYHFCWWQFHYAHHHWYYPHLSDHLVRHYRHHRGSMSGINRAVNGWVESEGKRLPKDWLEDDGNRADRFKEYGHFETSLAQYNKDRNNPVSREDFLDKRKKEYPSLVKSPTETRVTEPVKHRSTWEKDPPAEIRSTRIPNYSKPSEVRIEQPRTYDRINKAKDYHNNTWESRQRLPRQNTLRTPTRINSGGNTGGVRIKPPR